MCFFFWYIIQFVRIAPGSILQLLYPCSRYSIDKCFLCGGSYRDHLTLWWSKHLYTPYDRWLDQTNQEARPSLLILPTSTLTSRKTMDNTNLQQKQSKSKRWAFHRNYVIDDVVLRERATSRTKKTSKKTIVDDEPVPVMEQRQVLLNGGLMKYYIPQSSVPSQVSNSNNQEYVCLGPTILHWAVRALTLNAVDNLILLESKEVI
jgi:hypothetical protein